MKQVFNFTLEGKQVLGFNTGLDSQAFAQAKMAQFLTQEGYIVFPDGRVEIWKATGVEENPEGKMIIYGPAFHGTSFLILLESETQRDTLFDAVRHWINARIALEKSDEEIIPLSGAAGSFIALSSDGTFPEGTVFFAPDRIVKRCLESSDRDELEFSRQWTHPDLNSCDDGVFTAACMLYAVFSGQGPFTIRKEEAPPGKKAKASDLSALDILRQDIGESVYLPPELAAPGLDPDMCKLIRDSLVNRKPKPGKNQPQGIIIPISVTLEKIAACVKRHANVNSWFHETSDEKKGIVIRERQKFEKSVKFRVNSRRFAVRNATIITVCAAAVIALSLIVQSFVRSNADRPNTIGMNPVQVIQTYYGAFGSMDHGLMESCVINKAGKADITMITNLYVMSKMRTAYEPEVFSVSAQDWIDYGRPDMDIVVFGVTDLEIKFSRGSIASGEVHYQTQYTLWMPPAYMGEDMETAAATDGNFFPGPVPLEIRDTLILILHKNAWRISLLERANI